MEKFSPGEIIKRAFEVNDLKIDPDETHNLAEAKPGMVTKLIAMCEKWKIENQIVDYAEIIKIKPQDPY